MEAVKIYFGENLLVLAEKKSQENPQWENIFHDPSQDQIATLLRQLQNGKMGNTLITGNPERLLSAICKHFRIMEAGGGIVINPFGELLLIFRRDKWDLPKGKMDEGETIEACAVREVTEETGLNNIHILQSIGVTRHVYNERDDMILKKTHWYEMQYFGSGKLIPQIEEEITDARWVPAEELSNFLNKTYPSIKDILHQWKPDQI